MRVKFFSAEPQKLRDEYTRYLFVLQLRKQLEQGTLHCTDDQVLAELAAFLLQGEFGNYDPRQHTPAFVSTIPFYPHDCQTETLELAILQEYKKLRSREWTPEEADRIFLDRVRFLPNYGVDMHIVKGKDNENYTLGLTPTGILVYEDEEKIGLFVWSMILKLDMHGKKLKLVVAEENEQARKVMEHTFVFVLPDARACKHLWKSAVEHHAFFRLKGVPRPPTKLQQFFRLKSRFYASFRTEHQLAQENNFGSSSFRRRNTSTGQSLRSDASAKALNRLNSGTGMGRSNSSFKRVSTRRVAARPSFVNRSTGRPQPSAGNQVLKPPTRSVKPPTVEDTRAHSPVNPNSPFVEYTV
nr:E3 ubiquitin protein ligase MYLIP [Hymenolepis microstoma]